MPRKIPTIAILALVVANLVMIGLAVVQYPDFFSQPGAHVVVLESSFTLVAYAVAALWVGRPRGADRDIIVSAALFGLLGGTVEALNIGTENGIPAAIHAPALPIAFLLTIIGSWGIAGFRTARDLNSIRAGLLAAVSSAAICMLIAVTAGFVIQLFAARPEPAYIATWDEFKRSGWTDARAFGLANTLDSAFTHLIFAPIVALVFGGVASLFAQSKSSRETSTTSRVAAQTTAR
jgi:hypothetical protein